MLTLFEASPGDPVETQWCTTVLNLLTMAMLALDNGYVEETGREPMFKALTGRGTFEDEAAGSSEMKTGRPILTSLQVLTRYQYYF